MNLEVDMVDLAIFDMLKDYTPCDACKKMQHNGKQYFSVPYKKVLSELPLLPITKSDGIYRRFKKLEQAGIIEMHPDNAKMSMVWFSWGRNFQAMCFNKTPGFKTEGEQPNPRFLNRTPPDEKPTHNIPFPIPFSSSSQRAENSSHIEANPSQKEKLPAAGAEISRLRALIGADYRIKEGFCMSRKIPSSKFEDYLTAFEAETGATGEVHSTDQDLVKHFLNFSGVRYSVERKEAAINNKSIPKSSIPKGIRTFGS